MIETTATAAVLFAALESPGVASALFTQLDWRIGLIIDLQLAQQVPLVEP